LQWSQEFHLWLDVLQMLDTAVRFEALCGLDWQRGVIMVSSGMTITISPYESQWRGNISPQVQMIAAVTTMNSWALSSWGRSWRSWGLIIQKVEAEYVRISSYMIQPRNTVIMYAGGHLYLKKSQILHKLWIGQLY
jgi:hypothetical protein